MSSFQLPGKVALVTGGARGIGFQTARALHQKGAAVVIVDLDPVDAERAAQEIGAGAIGLAADVTDLVAMKDVVELAVERFGGLDLVVANAGMMHKPLTVRALEPALFDRVLEVNLLGAHRTVLMALPELIARRGHIVVISSVYAFLNGMLAAAYAAAKAGVEQLGRSLRAELAPYGVSVSVAYWGLIDTAMSREGMDDPLGKRLLATMPRLLVTPVGPEVAAAAVVRGVEHRAPRIIAPRRWVPLFMLQGLMGPMLDRRFERHQQLHDIALEADRVDERVAESAASAR